MTLFQDLYKNFGDLEKLHQSVQDGFTLPKTENIYDYTKEELVNIGGAKQNAIDEHNKKLEAMPASFLGAIGGNFRFDTFTGTTAETILQGPQPVDPEFDANKALETVKEEFPVASDQETLKQARNEEHFNMLAHNLKDLQEHRLNMERLGFWPGLASRLFAEAPNIVNWIPALQISKAGHLLKVKDVIKGTALQGVTNVAEEKLIDQVYNNKTASDYTAAFAMGAGMAAGMLGGAKLWNQTKFEAGVRVKSEADAFAVNSIKAKADEDLANAQAGPKPNRDWIDSSHLRDEEGNLNPTIKKAMEKKGYDPDNDLDVWVQNYESNGLVPKVKKVVQERLKLAGFSQTLAGSDSPFIRSINRALFEHGEGGTGVHKEHTAALEAEVETHRLFDNYSLQHKEYKALFATEAEKHGIPMKEFDRIAYRYIDGEGTIGFDGRIVQPGEHKLNDILEEFRQVYTQHNKGLVDHIRSAGVKEAETFGESAHLFRKYDAEQFLKLTQELGSDKPIKELLANSLRKGQGFENYSKRVLADAEAKFKAERTEYQTKLKDLEGKRKEFEDKVKNAKNEIKASQAAAQVDKTIRKIEDLQKTEPKRPEIGEIDTEKVIKRVSEAVYNRMYRRSYTNDADANLLSTNNQTLLLEALQDLMADGRLDKADLDHVKGILDTAGKDRAGDPTKGRLDMDMNVSIAVNGREVRMTDLLDVDLGAGYLSAGRYWIGRAALARKGDMFASEDAISKSLDRAGQMATKQGMDGKEVKKQIDTMRKGIDLIKGRPIEDMSSWQNKAMRNIRKAVVNSTLGKLGIIQSSETGRLLAAIDSAQRLPAIKELTEGILTGKLDSSQLRAIQDHLVGNIAARQYMNHPDFRADDFGHRLGPIEKFQDKMSYYLAKASGWNRVYVAQNQVLVNGLTQKWYRDVMNGTFKETQMRDLGVDDLLLKDLKEEMTKHATKQEGLDGTLSYTELGLENWRPDVRRKFAMMLHRKSTNAIQMINVGETPMWLNTSIGKFLGQFRSFSIGALSKQTTRDYNMLKEGDWEGALAMQFSVATSVMANTAKIGFVAATLSGDKRQEYLEKALRPVSLVNQIASYVGSASPLMDAMNMTGDTLFGDTWDKVAGGRYFRGQGLTQAVPGLKFIDKTYQAVSGGLSAGLTDKELSPADYRAMTGIIPFSNNYAFEAINNVVLEPTIFKE